MTGTVNLVTTCVLVAQMVQLLLVPEVESPENSCRMSRDSLIFLQQPATAVVTCRGRPSRSVCANTNVASLGAVGHCEEFDPVLVHRAKMEEKDFTDKMGVYDVVPRSDAAKKGCRVIRTRWVTVNKGSDNPQIRARWVAHEFRGCGDKHEYFSETPDLALVKAVIAHAARWAEREDVVVAVFDVRRAYFYAEEKRDTFVELPDYMPAEFRATHVGKLRKALYGTRPAAASWGDELRKDSSVAVSLLVPCRVVAFAMSPVPLRGQCMVMTSLSLVLARIQRRWGRHSRRDGKLVIR